jgi:WD40 repeat protein
VAVTRSGFPARPLVIDAKVQVNNVAFSPDGRYVAGTTDFDSKSPNGCEVIVWALPKGEEVVRLPLVKHLWGGHGRCTFSPDGRLLATGTPQGVFVWSVGSWERHPVLGANQYFDVRFSADSRRVAGAGGAAEVWDVATGVPVATLRKSPETRGDPFSLAYHPSGHSVAVGGWGVPGNKTVSDLVVWDLPTQTPKYVLKAFHNGIWGLAFSPDGRWLVTGAGNHMGQRNAEALRDGAVQVWDAETGKPVYDVRGHTTCVWSVAVSPDGKRLATAAGKRVKTQKGEARVWDLTTGKELMFLQEHDGAVLGVGFSADRRWFGTTGMDGKVRIWDIGPEAEEVARRLPAAR